MSEVPEYVAERLRRPVPHGCSVVAGSTPVVSFGNVETAWVATLGLNPSLREFAKKDGTWLDGTQRRLAGLDLLGIDDAAQATDEQVEQIVTWCYEYFQRNPYSWFDALESLMVTAVGSSYYDGTACHLDLVQWATNPVWQHLNPPVRSHLIADDREFLREQLRWEGIRLVLMNGRSVLDEVAKSGVELHEVQSATVGPRSCSVMVGEADGVTFIGWSANLQSSYGMSADFKTAIAERVKAEVRTAGVDQRSTVPALGRYVPRGSVVESKTDLVALLEAWLVTSDAATIGDVSTFGGRAWLTIKLDGHKVVLNSDTKREAVEAFVRSGGYDTAWHVIANSKGTVNKVVYTLSEDLPGWYCYVHPPRTKTGKL